MLKKILAILAMLYAVASFAAVDANKATAAELDAVKGIGPTTSKAIVAERKKGDFKSWEDLIARVKGIGETKAAHLSKEGLTVGGAEFKKAAAKEAKKDAKAAAKEEKKETKAEKKEEKKDAKAEKKEEKAMAKAEKKDDKKAADAKPAASAKK